MCNRDHITYIHAQNKLDCKVLGILVFTGEGACVANLAARTPLKKYDKANQICSLGSLVCDVASDVRP